MAKPSTKKIQQKLLTIGEQLGFIAKSEYSFSLGEAYYELRYDVVWFLDTSDLQFNKALVKLLGKIPYIFKGDLLPIAAFEVEGSTSSSKNQLGNIQNLLISQAFLKFFVVDNIHATTENDTYRRAIKIIKSSQAAMGEKNIFLIDASYLLKDVESNTLETSTDIPRIFKETKGSGGEKHAAGIRKKCMGAFKDSNVDILADYSPPQLNWNYSIDQNYQNIKGTKKDNILLKKSVVWEPSKKSERTAGSIGRLYYVPKVDIGVGINLPRQVTDFLVYPQKVWGKMLFTSRCCIITSSIQVKEYSFL